MEKVMSQMEAFLAPLANKIGSNKLLKTVSTAFNMMMPIIIIGAIFSLVTTLQVKPYQDLLAALNLAPILALASRFTTDMMAVYVAFAGAYAYVRNEGMSNDAILAGLLSLMSYFIISPLTSVMVNDAPVTMISFDYLGSKGLFTALLVGILVGFLYTFIISHNWVIKMPDGVPPTVAKSFSALIPGFVIAAFFLAVNGIFAKTVGLSFSEWFYGLIATPLSSLSGSLLTFMVLNFIASAFWFFGIHGGQVAIPIMMMLFLQPGMENQTAFASGLEMTNVLTLGLLFYLMLGGIGNTIGLAINMFFFAKSERYKALGKIAILPSLCSINEPIMFGMPIMLNPVMALPFFIVPQIILVATYFVMNVGLVSLPRIAMGATGTPILLDGWLMAGISGVVWQVVLVAFSVVIYMPFFKVQDKLAFQEEQKSAASSTEAAKDRATA